MDANISFLSSQMKSVIWESREQGELFSPHCTLTWTFIAWRRWVWLQQRIMVLMTDPSAVSLCGMQSASLLLLWHHTHTYTDCDITLGFNQSYLLGSAKISSVSRWFIYAVKRLPPDSTGYKWITLTGFYPSAYMHKKNQQAMASRVTHSRRMHFWVFES